MYDGYIYIWFDTKLNWFYIGGHKGLVKDCYICSSKTMMRAYRKRPETFKLKILEYVVGSVLDIRKAEQKWLDKIKSSELLNTKNLREGTVKYYNVKQHAAGGNGSANKGNSNIGGSNRKSWKVQSPTGEIIDVSSSGEFCRNLGKRWSSLFRYYKENRTPKSGEWAGWRIIE